jgi:hypothetical protein
MIRITPVYDLTNPSPAINEMVPIRVDMAYAGKTLTFIASDAISAWNDTAARDIATNLLAVMLHTITAKTP